MNAAYLWILFPLIIALILLFLQRYKVLVAVVGTIISALLAGLAAWLPVQEQLFIWRWAIPFSDTFILLGRRLTLSASDRPSLVIIYFIAALWFGAAPIAKSGRLFVPFGLGMIALLTAAIAVEPFLFAAVFIEIAVLVSIPILSPPGRPTGRGVLRYLSFQTMGMPFILISGFMLAGFEVGTGDQDIVVIATAIMAIGFGLLLAVFPFHTWIPMLAQESRPYPTAFVFLLLPGAVTLLGLGFLDRFVWLQNAPNTSDLLQGVGVLMIVTAGIWASVERNLARMMGFALMLDIGFSFMIIGLATLGEGGSFRWLFFASLVTRGLSLGVWALALSGLRSHVNGFDLKDLKGVGRKYPIILTSVIAAIFCLAGIPLLASFPMRLVVIEGLSLVAPQNAVLAILGSFGLLIAAFRTLSTMVTDLENDPWLANESRILAIFLMIGLFGLLLLGLFPNLLIQLLTDLPAVLGQFTP